MPEPLPASTSIPLRRGTVQPLPRALFEGPCLYLTLIRVPVKWEEPQAFRSKGKTGAN